MENHIAKIEQQIASERTEANSVVSSGIKELHATHGTKYLQARIRLKELRARQKTLNSATPFFVDLPQPVATAKTDSEGRFELTIPDTGEYVLVASAERSVLNPEADLLDKKIRFEDALHDTDNAIADLKATGDPFKQERRLRANAEERALKHLLAAPKGTDNVERYFWIVRVNAGESKATLSNDNLTTSGSADSLLTTKE